MFGYSVVFRLSKATELEMCNVKLWPLLYFPLWIPVTGSLFLHFPVLGNSLQELIFSDGALHTLYDIAAVMSADLL